MSNNSEQLNVDTDFHLPTLSFASKNMGKVRNFIRSTFHSESEELSEIANYLFSLGGKQIRPQILLSAARMAGLEEEHPSFANVIKIAGGIELIHMATLLHDDIVDESSMRRKRESAYKKYGIVPTLLTGDFLLVRAFGICAGFDFYVTEKTEKACIELTEGEIIEGKMRIETPISREQYLTIARKKTASLFELSCRMGTWLVDEDNAKVEQMAQFGNTMGIAFQIIDDILDVVADELILGKPLGTDLRQKTPSLVNVIWMEKEPELAQKFFNIDTPSECQCMEAIEHLKNSKVIEECRNIAQKWSDKTIALVKQTPVPKDKQSVVEELTALVEYMNYRLL